MRTNKKNLLPKIVCKNVVKKFVNITLHSKESMILFLREKNVIL